MKRDIIQFDPLTLLLTTRHMADGARQPMCKWGAAGAIDVAQVELDSALGGLRDDETKLAAHGWALAEAVKLSASMLDRHSRLVHVWREEDGADNRDIPIELLLANRDQPNSFVGARYACSHLFNAHASLPLPKTVQDIFFVDGSGNAPSVARPDGAALRLDVLRREQFQPLLDALGGYPIAKENAASGLHIVCDGADERRFERDFARLDRGEIPQRPRDSIIIYAGHVAYLGDGSPHMVIRDRLVPVERLFALDPGPNLIVLIGCGPDRAEHMCEAPRRLICRDAAPGERRAVRAHCAISAAFDRIAIDAAIALFARLFDLISASEGAVPMDELMRQARRQALAKVHDGARVRSVLAFRYFGACDYKPQFPPQRRRIRVNGKLALLLILLAALCLSPVRRPALDWISSIRIGAELPAPAIGDIAFNGPDTLTITVADSRENTRVGVFLKVLSDENWYCKDAGMVRDGDRFTARWRVPGTNDTNAEKLAIFVYETGSVHTTDAYVLVKAHCIDERELTRLPD